MIRFSCPGCGATYSVDDAKAGKTGKCPKCQSQFVIPAAEVDAGATQLPPDPPPTTGDPNAPVEIAPCPKCQARLSVAATDLGSDVECPYCQTVYKALKPGTAGSTALSPRVEADWRTGRRPAKTEADDRPSRRGRRAEDEEDDRPSRRRQDDDEDEDDRPRRPARRDDDDEDVRPRRRKSARRRGRPGDVPNYLVHSIVVTLCCCLIGGIIAIVNAAKVNTLLAEGDIKGAEEASAAAKKWCIISVVLGLISNVAVIGLQILAAAAGGK